MAYAVLAIAVAVKVLFIGPGELPEPALAYLRWWNEQPQSAVERAVGWISLFTVGISIASALAMIVFARWARPVFAACIVLAIALQPLMDYPTLQSPGEYFLDTLLAVIAGAIIVFSYWSKAGDRFAKSAP
jgi:hypothetical protein